MSAKTDIDFFSFYKDKFSPDYYGELETRQDEIDALMPYKSILGVGSGRAIIEDYLASIGKKVTASDIDGRLVDLAKSKLQYLTSYIVADCRNLPFPENHLEAVFSQGLLEHIKFPGQLTILKEMWRVCSKAVVFAVPSPDYQFDSFGEEYRFSSSQWITRLKYFFNHFTVKTYRETLGTTILGVIEK